MTGTRSEDSTAYRRNPLTGDVVLYAPGQAAAASAAGARSGGARSWTPNAAPLEAVTRRSGGRSRSRVSVLPGKRTPSSPHRVGGARPDKRGMAHAGGAQQVPDRARRWAPPGGHRDAAARRGPRESCFRPSGDRRAHRIGGRSGRCRRAPACSTPCSSATKGRPEERRSRTPTPRWWASTWCRIGCVGAKRVLIVITARPGGASCAT